MALTGETTGAAIFARLIRSDVADWPLDAARTILAVEFPAADRQRMHDLAEKNRDGVLTADELAEMDEYCRVGRLLELMRSKARRSLKGKGG